MMRNSDEHLEANERQQLPDRRRPWVEPDVKPINLRQARNSYVTNNDFASS